MIPSPRSRPFAALVGVSTVLLGAAWAQDAKAPSPLDGAWTWSWQDPKGETHRHVLEVEGIAGKLAAREIQDDLPPVPVKDLTVAAKKVHFTVIRDAKRAEYNGALGDPDPDTISGKVSVTLEGETTDFLWKAVRRKPSE